MGYFFFKRNQLIFIVSFFVNKNRFNALWKFFFNVFSKVISNKLIKKRKKEESVLSKKENKENAEKVLAHFKTNHSWSKSQTRNEMIGACLNIYKSEHKLLKLFSFYFHYGSEWAHCFLYFRRLIQPF